MTKAEEKKLEEAAERLIKKMEIKEGDKYCNEEIRAYWNYSISDEKRYTLIATIEAVPEYEILSWKRICDYNRSDLKEFVKFLLKIRKEEKLKLIFWKEPKK